MNEKGKKLLSYPLEIMSWLGQNPEQSRVKYGPIQFLLLLCGISAQATILIQFLCINGNITAVAQNCEATAACIQFISRILVGLIKNKKFRDMIDDTKHFWDFRRYLNDAQINIEQTLENTLRLEKFYFRLSLLAAIFFEALSVFNKKLPTGVWILTGYNQVYSYVLIFHQCLFPALPICVTCFDCLFLSFCINLGSQYKMLNFLLKELQISCISSEKNEKYFLYKLKSYIQYHNFLLRYSQNLQNTYSPILLTQYFSSLLFLVGEMYILFESTDIIQFPRYAVAMVPILMQHSIYCITLNYVTDEALSVSQGIYKSDWHSKYVSTLKTAMVLIIQRSQREIVFRAGGLLEVNCRTIPSVVKTSYSICTILRVIKKI